MNKKLRLMRKKLIGMSEEFYDYGTLTKHDYDLLIENQKSLNYLRDRIKSLLLV